MKLYLATSSLNIDNILSTESVAPYSFYQLREYGYSSYLSLDLIPFKNVIILFLVYLTLRFMTENMIVDLLFLRLKSTRTLIH